MKLRKKTTAILLIAIFMISTLAVIIPALANTIESSTMHFEGTLTPDGDGYIGIIPMIVGGGYDIYAKEGASAWFGDGSPPSTVWTEEIISDHDGWPTWTPDTPDWYQYSLELYKEAGVYKWAVRNHPSATAEHPWYDTSHWGGEKPPCGVPMSGVIVWRGDGTGYAFETDVGEYLPSTGTPEIPGGAATHGGGAACWDMDWSWGSEVVPLEYGGFEVKVKGKGDYLVTLKPARGIRIKDGVLTYSTGHNLAGQPLMMGYDPYGYNYQGHMFNGYYCNVYLGRDGFPSYEGDDEAYLAENPTAAYHWTWPYREVKLVMKWNDAWLSNMDCDGDGLLDRYYGYTSYIGSGAWETNHQFGSYWDLEGVWELQFDHQGNLFDHEMTITSDGYEFEGTGSWPAGGPIQITWTVDGSVTDSADVELTIAYDGSTYEVTAIGKVSEDGTLSGTWTSSTNQVGTWQSTEGSGDEYEWDYFVKIVAAPADAYAVDGFWYSADDIEIGPVIWGSFAVIQRVYNDPHGGYEGIEYLSSVSAGFGYYQP